MIPLGARLSPYRRFVSPSYPHMLGHYRLMVEMRRAAALSAIAFSLLLVGCSRQRPSTGIFVNLLSRGPDPFPRTTDADGLYVMTVLPQRRVRIRREEIVFEDLGKRIEELFRTREERLLLVRVEGQVEYGDVIAALDRVSSRVRLRYGLMTGHSQPTPAEPSLFMAGKFIYTQYFVPERHRDQ